AGGMGEVYLAEDTKLDRKVALKFLPSHLCEDEDCRARFKREAQAAAKLNHPNIIHVYEVSEFQGRPFFAMEHVEGQSLKEVIRGGDLSLDRIVDLAIQICEGLSKAHQSGIIHRDVKPSNIVIDADGRPKLLDFGLAAVQGIKHITKTGSTLGTVGYMSPEQIQAKEVDHRSDLFSFGVVLYELTTGHAPFKGETEATTLNSVLNDKPEPLSRFKSGVSDDLQRIVTKLLEKDPSLRYQSAAGVVSDLKRLTVGTGVVSEKPRKDWWNRYVVPGALLVLVVLVAFWYLQFQPDGDDDGIKSLVVLPFENLGAEGDEYFADGMTDEITARLAGFGGLRVISRTSAVHYKGSGKPLKVIAKELKVDYVLEGTIRWDKSGDTDRVRIIPQLIRASDDSHVWASAFERALTQVFAVQEDIATRIAEALDVTLLDSEKQILAAKPTDNLEAYDYYLRGKEYWDQGKNSSQSIEMFEKAIAFDSLFYAAYAWLPRLYGYEYINDVQMTDERKAQAKDAAEKAFRLADGKPDGYLGLGYYHYYFSRDYDRALELFEQALQGQPNNSELIAAIAYVQRRMGNWDAAVANLRRALRLNPFSKSDIDGLTRSLALLHRIEEAEEVVDNSLEFAPDNAGLLFWKAVLVFYSGRDSSVVRAVLREYARSAPPSTAAFILETGDIFWRDYHSALMRRTVPTRPTTGDSVEFYIQRGYIYRFMGDSSASQIYFDSAWGICEERIRTDPEVALFHADMAQACAGVGQKQRAVQEGELAAELLPVSKDEMQGPDILHTLAEVYIMVGEYDLAIDQLDYLLSHPSSVQIEAVRGHPIYDALRDHPRFQALIEKCEKKHGI
ncbi:MAG: protein kinase, partial [candidate division Zixibacteria bacterium]|nr:protein kinase [candidate division Zixibacteria bacterium]